MTDAGPPRPSDLRRLSDEEVRVVLERAGRDAALPVAVTETTSVRDLMAAAAEVGLDPQEVRRAALVEGPDAPSPAVRLTLGAPDRREVRAHLPGASLPEDRQALVRAAQAGVGRRGSLVESTADRFVWREDHTLGRTAVTAETGSDGIDVTVRSDRAGHYAGAWFGGLVVWAAVLGAVPAAAALPPLVLAASFLALPFLAARPFWVRADAKVIARLEDTLLRVLRAAETAPAPLPGTDTEDGPGTLPPGPDGH
ncbi:MAG: hypothetical protein RH859_08680 [Longimicrobiales bacterium]